jgi:hypothetical protein
MAWREAAPAAGPPRPRCASFVSPHAGSRAAFWYLLLPSAAFLAFLVGFGGKAAPLIDLPINGRPGPAQCHVQR